MTRHREECLSLPGISLSQGQVRDGERGRQHQTVRERLDLGDRRLAKRLLAVANLSWQMEPTTEIAHPGMQQHREGHSQERESHGAADGRIARRHGP